MDQNLIGDNSLQNKTQGTANQRQALCSELLWKKCLNFVNYHEQLQLLLFPQGDQVTIEADGAPAPKESNCLNGLILR